MSDTGMSCVQCGQPNDKMWQLCAQCSGAKVNLQAKSKQGARPVNEPTWETALQDRKSVEAKGFGYFSKNSDSIAAAMLADADGHQNDKEATNLNKQYTVQDYGETVTLDYQGTRQGGNTFWIDYQGQVGKGNARCTYFQVMIQCCGQLPSEAIVEAALRSSLNGGQKRAVLYLHGTVDRPK